MLVAQNISKSFTINDSKVPVLRDVSFHLNEGDFVSIIGRSGSGKSTLLNVLSTLMRPDAGVLSYRNSDLAAIPESRLNLLRNSDFSVIFQFHHLLPYLSVLENTLLPFMNTFKPIRRPIHEKAMDCLERVGLSGKADRLPGMLSGGEQQRVAIARALVKSSKILFADEPTGSLDKATGEQIIDLLERLNEEGLTIVMVTHETSYARRTCRRVEIEDGRIIN